MTDLPHEESGYGSVVARDLNLIVRRYGRESLRIICHARSQKASKVEYDIIPKRRTNDWRRMLRFISSKYPSVCPTAGELQSALLGNVRTDLAICGDTVLYPALRKILPSAVLIVRFHNLLSDVLGNAQKINRLHMMPLYYLELRRYRALETEILMDPRVIPIMLCEEEAEVARRLVPDRKVFVRKVLPKRTVAPIPAELDSLVWFGGLSAHKLLSMRIFLRDYWNLIRRLNPGLKLHLYGVGTEKLSGPGIQGYGRYLGDDYPMLGKALYINPDIVAGGVKMKMLGYIENGVPFISTPSGVQGIDVPSNPFWHVVPIERWPQSISKIILESGVETA